ncbi:class I SAM-dependent methyltransferase [Niallia taxi]|uniref:class I SAM-dependent methyltransferase n=1 Tax=Niallia taxi TaxID=2499688 RepID=UPI0030095B7F
MENRLAQSWHEPNVITYEQKISRKIAGYSTLYDLTSKLMSVSINKEEEKSILIVGAGGGQELLALGDDSKWSFMAVDSSKPMLELAKSRTAELNKHICFQQQEWEEFSSSERFDGATCLLVLHFIKGIDNKRKFLKNIAKHLKPDAPFLVAAIFGDLKSTSFEMHMAAWKQYMCGNGVSEQEFLDFAQNFGKSTEVISDKQMVELLHECGFTEISRYFGSFLIQGFYCRRSKLE